MMTSSLKHLFYIIITISIASCASQKTRNSNYTVNTKFNKNYIASIQSFSGNLDNKQYEQITAALKKELKTEIPKDKAIFINYNQKAPNCISAERNKKNTLKGIENTISISKTLSTQYNAVDFFVFSKDTFLDNLLPERKDFIFDSGFFYNKVFTLHENCAAFFILKPNGDFMKYYGEDYYSLVEDFLEKK